MVQSRLPARYRVLEEVGQGGMAVVYRAHDDTLQREVAIKLLHPHLLAEPESKQRLQREAQAVAKLHHDNILQIFDYSGTDSQASYIVTEFIDGLTLKQFLGGRKLPLPEVAVLIAIGVGEALRYAHGLGIIHRDIKPENVMVRRDGVLKLMDFGVAQVLDLERMTVTGQLVGSPAYMAPEIFEGRPLDVRTDVFSVGVMLYQMATGALPFTGRNPHEVLKRIAEGRFPDPRTLNRLIADRLTRIIAKALAKKPDDRYATVGALTDDMRGFVADAGLEDTSVELKKFFTQDEAQDAELTRRVVAALVATGRKEHGQRKIARALEAWNRALALDPKNPDVDKALKRLEGRRTARAGGVVVGGTALMGGLIWAAFKLAREEVPEPVKDIIANTAAKEAAAAKAAPRPPGGAVPGPAPVTTKLPERKKAARVPPPPAPGKLEEFTIMMVPPGFYAVDGKKLPWGVQNNKVFLDASRPHKITFSQDACCLPQEYRVDPYSPIRDILVKLSPKGASLRLTLSPRREDARMTIRALDGGKPNGLVSSGDQMLIPFNAPGIYHRDLEVSVIYGDKTKTVPVTVSAGQQVPLTIPLD